MSSGAKATERLATCDQITEDMSYLATIDTNALLWGLGTLPKATLYSSDRDHGLGDKGLQPPACAQYEAIIPIYAEQVQVDSVVKMPLLIQYLCQRWHHKPPYDRQAHDAGAMLQSPAS